MNVTTAYANQTHQGIEVFNTTSRFAIRDGQVVSAKLSFASDVASKINTTAPSISARTAILKAAQALGLQALRNLKNYRQRTTLMFSKPQTFL